MGLFFNLLTRGQDLRFNGFGDLLGAPQSFLLGLADNLLGLLVGLGLEAQDALAHLLLPLGQLAFVRALALGHALVKLLDLLVALVDLLPALFHYLPNGLVHKLVQDEDQHQQVQDLNQ